MIHKRFYHRLFAWLTFLISFFVYFSTIAPTTSFWDCGEFITCSYVLGVPHPPGAPFYLLIGRLFSMIPWAADIGLRVNVISALTSALTVMLAYLIISKLISLWRGEAKNFEDYFIQIGGSFIGALAFAFSDSFWFNAVEAEVYAISMFFMALVVWLILVWYEKADEPAGDKYLILIAYCIGLSIGIHLLSILALPSIFLLYYFRKHSFQLNKFIIFIIISSLIFFIIYPVTVKKLPSLILILKTHFGISLAFYFTFLFIITFLIALIFSIVYKNRILSLFLVGFLMILLGASTFTGVYLRSNLNPVIDENNPENLENFVKYMNREQYGDWSLIERRAPLWDYQIKKMYLRYFGWQFAGKGVERDADGLLAETFSLRGFWGIPLLVGILGMAFHFFRDRRRALAILLLFLMTGLAIVIYLNQPDPQPRERDYVYVGSFFAFAFWIGIGAAAILELIHSRVTKININPKLKLALVSLILLMFIPVRMLAFNYHSHDRTGNYLAFDYSYNLLQSCEPNAILFTNGDNDTFPLWFLQYVYNIRRDVRVVNLSLLNTSWYIYQLRDFEPKVSLMLDNSQIDQLGLMYWPEKQLIRIKIPREIYQKELIEFEQRKESFPNSKDVQPEIKLAVGPTYMGKFLRVQDIMILNIIASNQFQKPIYFSITVSKENLLNLDDYLRMDGIAYKLVTHPGQQIFPSRLKENLLYKFKYRNLNNPEVHYNDDVIRLVNNYRSVFFKLATFYQKEKMYPDMIEVLDKMEEAIPEEVVPAPNRQLSFIVASLYLSAGRSDKFEKKIDWILRAYDIPKSEKLEYAQIYYQYLNNASKSESVTLEILEQNPDFKDAYLWLLDLYLMTKNYQKGLALFEKVESLFPGDSLIMSKINQLKNNISKPAETSKF